MGASAGSRDLVALRKRILDESTLPAERTQEILQTRFARVPHRVAFALRRWPLAGAAVLDVGCGYGTCLAHFGPGSLGVDNSEEAVAFCSALGLEAVVADIDEGLGFLHDAGPRFDFAWVSDILEHLDAPRLALRSLRGSLTERGRLLVFSGVLPRSRLLRGALRRTRRAPFDAQVHYHQFTVETLKHLLARAGYRVTAAVAPVPARVEELSRLVPVAQAWRVMLEAVPDVDLEQAVARAESRNRKTRD